MYRFKSIFLQLCYIFSSSLRYFRVSKFTTVLILDTCVSRKFYSYTNNCNCSYILALHLARNDFRVNTAKHRYLFTLLLQFTYLSQVLPYLLTNNFLFNLEYIESTFPKLTLHNINARKIIAN